MNKRNAVASVEEAFDAIDASLPEGWRVELIEGEIHVVPPANGEHEEIVSEITGQFRDHRKDLARYTGIGLRLPGGSSGDRVIPDVAIAPKGSFADDQEYHAPTGVLLVAEITSRSTGDSDRKGKLRGYARAGIPHYLLIDREAETATLFSEPEGEAYVRQVVVKLSGKLELPEPLGFVLDTGEF
jgi:Uma2 family endonuclease